MTLRISLADQESIVDLISSLIDADCYSDPDQLAAAINCPVDELYDLFAATDDRNIYPVSPDFLSNLFEVAQSRARQIKLPTLSGVLRQATSMPLRAH